MACTSELLSGDKVRAVSIALAAAGFFVSCDRSPTGPTSGTKPGDPVISGVQIVGPREIPPGETVQLQLVATMSDRTTRDVTNEANWTSGDGLVASIAAPGRVTGRERGTALIEARFDEGRGRKEVFVLPAGTYRLYGRLIERRFPDKPLAGARVEVTTGAGARLSTLTDREGVFYLYGVSGETSIEVTMDGYSRATHAITLADHQWITIEVPFWGKYPDLSGSYALTISAASDCGIGLGKANLPEDVRVRSYTATVQQDGPTLWVTLSGSGLYPAQGFYGSVELAGAVFSLRNPDDGQPIGELLTRSRVLFIEGSAVVTTGREARLTGTLSGELRMVETPSWKPIAWCSSTNHQFVLSR